MGRYSSGSLGDPANLKKPLVFGKYAYRLLIALSIMAGVGIISLVLIWLYAMGGF
jgi:hypothetical protein